MNLGEGKSHALGLSRDRAQSAKGAHMDYFHNLALRGEKVKQIAELVKQAYKNNNLSRLNSVLNEILIEKLDLDEEAVILLEKISASNTKWKANSAKKGHL